MKMKNIMSIVLAAVLSLGVLTGCGQAGDGSGEKDGSQDTGGAKGRYLEEDIALPEKTSVYGMTRLEDGTLRIAAQDQEGRSAVWELSKGGDTWEKVYDLPEEWRQTDTFYVTHVCLSPKGDAFAATSQTLEQEQQTDGEMLEAPQMEEHFYHLDGEGNATEVPIKTDGYLYFLRYTEDGELLAQFQGMPVSSVDMKTGELTDKASGLQDITFFGVAKDLLYVVDYEGQIHSFDVETGDPLPKDEGLIEAVSQSGVSLDLHSLQTLSMLFAGGKEEGEIFFCTSKGLYRHMKDGDVSELVVDGSLTSLGSPDMGLVSLEATEDGEFYLLGVDSQSDKLLHYTYSKDTATVPGTEVKAWSLYENSELRQNISQYQKENPDVYVDLEVAVTEENGVTTSDALKNLSTEIMAGNGPDMMLLDGLPVESYVEKGMLEDLADVANGGEDLFTNISAGLEQDGKICGIPLRFALPIVEADTGSLDKIQDLQSLADTAEELKGTDPDKYIYSPYYDGAMLASLLYDACAAAWVREDGSIDSALLREFYTQLARIWDPEKHIDMEVEYAQIAESGSYRGYVGSLGGGVLQMYCDKFLLNFGALWSVSEFSELATTMTDKEGIGYKPLTGQAADVFVPKMIAGINSRSAAKEEAKKFVQFLLTEEAQIADQAGGLPVSEKALRAQIGRIEGSTIGSGMANDPDSYVEMTIKKPSPEAADQFIACIQQADTPALTNEIIRDAVLSQARECLDGKITPEAAAQAVTDKVDLYLAE